MSDVELRILLSLLMKMGMNGQRSLSMMREHGITEEQIASAKLDEELRTREEIEQLRKN